MSFPTPKPYDRRVSGGLYEANSLTALFIQHQAAAVVTPDPQKEKMYLGPSESEGHQVSFQLASEALAMVQGGLSSPRDSTRTLAPRPGKLERNLPYDIHPA